MTDEMKQVILFAINYTHVNQNAVEASNANQRLLSSNAGLLTHEEVLVLTQAQQIASNLWFKTSNVQVIADAFAENQKVAP